MANNKSIHLEVGDIVQYFNDHKMIGLLVSIHRARHSIDDSYGVKWFDEEIHHRWDEPLQYIKHHLVKVTQ
jgi:hypothetical protein